MSKTERTVKHPSNRLCRAWLRNHTSVPLSGIPVDFLEEMDAEETQCFRRKGADRDTLKTRRRKI